MSHQPEKNSRRRQVGTVLLLIPAVFLLVALIVLSLDHRSLLGELTAVRNRRDALQQIADRLPKEETQLQNNARITQDVLRQCRTVEDIPDLGGDRVIAILYSSNSFHLNFYVPEGSHSLEITADWKPAPLDSITPADGTKLPKDDGLDSDHNPHEASGEEIWRFPLVAASGYILTLDDHRRDREGPLKWKVVGNHKAFETREATIPLESFEARGWSWNRHRTFAFPNQVEPTGNLRSETNEAPGVRLMNVTLRGPRREIQYVVRFTVRVCSEGPRCLPATAAIGYFMRKKENQFQPYRGNGKFDLRD